MLLFTVIGALVVVMSFIVAIGLVGALAGYAVAAVGGSRLAAIATGLAVVVGLSVWLITPSKAEREYQRSYEACVKWATVNVQGVGASSWCQP